VYHVVVDLSEKTSEGAMKRRDLEKKMKGFGWEFLRHGGNHDIWTNGQIEEPVPRHKEISDFLAKKILKKCKTNPRKTK